MEVFPAIDIRGGRVVRLRQGDPERETEYGADPLATAEAWEAEGVPRLHVVDLDGAFEGAPRNLPIIVQIARSVRIPLQVGGGLRRMEDIEAVLDAGADRAILGTVGVTHPELLAGAAGRYPGRILLGIDARQGVVAVEGWAQETRLMATELALRVSSLPLGAIIYTDILRDGTLWGVNLDGLRAIAGVTTIPLMASGGISSVGDLAALARLEPRPPVAVVIGKAFYSGALSYQQAVAAARVPRAG